MNIFNLEYSKMDKAEILTHLDKMFASYYIYLHKVKMFIWNVGGRDSFDLRNEFKDIYDKSFRHMDEISERIRLFNQVPVSKLYEIIKISEIKEGDLSLTSFEMVKSLLNDIIIMLSLQSDSIEKAQKLSDYGSEIMIKNLTKELEQDYFVLVSWLK
ncbi:MAG: ferritin-like domain-containing protein [Bacteroidota bacterium]|nr:ferritin-like domain-containing protein [Bacteroidota bacterium]